MNTPDTSDNGHNNWLIVGEALRITKTALEPFIQDTVDRWHAELCKRLQNKGTCTNTVSCNQKKANQCCSCAAWRNEIDGVHTGTKQWKNADWTKWATQGGSWEVAKVFMSYLGDMKASVTNAQSTDIAGLLNLLRFLPREAYGSNQQIELAKFRAFIEDVSKKARNKWAHSPQQTMEIFEKDEAFKSLERFLENSPLVGMPAEPVELEMLQDLQRNGMRSILHSENNCQELLIRELVTDLAELKFDFCNRSNIQDQEMKQLQAQLIAVSASVDKCTFEITKMSEKHDNGLVVMKKEFEHLKDMFDLINYKDLKAEVETLKEKFKRIGSVPGLLNSCIPDSQENIYGRDTDIQNIVDLIKEKPCVVLTGGPGFGKTTVAIQVANILNEEKKVVIFISLRDMHTIKSICGRILSSVGRNPKEKEVQELMQWAGSLEEEVVLILDNSEDAIQSDINAGFCELLQNCRTNSKSKLRYLITSRESFELSNMEVKTYEIKALNHSEGVKVIYSRISLVPSTGLESKLLELAYHCGGIPLALRIAGSLLVEVDIDSLIKELKSDPLQVLENKCFPVYHRSISAAIGCSFCKLDDSLKVQLVQLSVFRGSFDKEAASDIWEEKSLCKVVKLLLELTQKSLLDKLGSTNRYQLHPFVQRYLQDVKAEEYKEKVAAAGNNFMCHYLSIMVKGTELFWSTGGLSSSVKLFRNDASNIESALYMCFEKGEMEQNVLSKARLICFYLDRCVTYKVTDFFLQACLQSVIKQSKKCNRIEIHCLIGYQEWEKGNLIKYKRHMCQAKTFYEEVKSQLDIAQRWFYLHSCGLFFDQQRSRHSRARPKSLEQAMEMSLNALGTLQNQESNDSCDLALTLIQIGSIEKHRKRYSEAEDWLQKGLEARTKHLGGDHILTAIAQKHLADLYLTKGENNKALELYKQTLDTYERMSMANEKQCIYLLKNMASCYKYLGLHNPCLKKLKTALEMAERLLVNPDHKVKVNLNAEMAIVYRGISDEVSKKHAQVALEMAERLKVKLLPMIKQQLQELLEV